MKIGIDLGGSHIGVGLVDNKGILIVKREIDMIQNKDGIENFIINNIRKLIIKVLEEKKIKISDIEVIGIAAPGIVKKGVIVKSKNLNLNKFSIVAELKKHFPIPIILRNDGKCAALAEKEYGNLKPYADAIFLNIGTGIGGAIFEDGKMLESSRGAGYEVGHIIIEKNGRQCSCGNLGCFEAYASIGSLKKIVADKFNLSSSITGKVVLELLRDEELQEKCEPIVESYIDNLSIGIANLFNIFEPEAIVIRW